MDTQKALEHLLKEAQGENPLQLIFALLRVGYIESYPEDPLFLLEKKLLRKDYEKQKIILESELDFWRLIADLSRVASGEQHRPNLFFCYDSKKAMSEAIGLVRFDLADFLRTIFSSEWNTLSSNQKVEARNFILSFFKAYREILGSFKDYPKCHKLPNFEVLELLTDEDIGLFGFKVHFSNGSKAIFKRTSKGTLTVNLSPAPGRLSFMVGNISELKHEWMVGDKRLFEIGIPGRYNRPGEWAPLVYPGESGKLQEEAIKLAKGDEQTEGVYFYIFCTGYWCIEFAVKAPIDLLDKVSELPGKVLLYKVEPDEKFQSEIVYDGSLYLKNYKLKTIQEGIQRILRAMNGLSLAFDKPVHWELKYSIRSHSPGSAAAKTKDAKFLNMVTKKLQKDSDLYIDAAVDWYQRGLASKNVFNKFISYHIAIEGLAMKLVSGELKSSEFFGLKKTTKLERRKQREKCIERYYKKLYKTNPTEFVIETYRECVVGLRAKIETALKKVFGDKSSILKEYFEGKESIWSLRGDIVHEAYSDWHFEKKDLIRKKSYLLQEITKEFLVRIIMQIKPKEKAPTWSGHSFYEISMFSPKGALVASHLRFFPVKDWKIKASWIESR